MSDSVICDCGWKIKNPSPGQTCPMCGEPVDNSPDKRVRQWNSTLKADPSKRPKQSKKIRMRSRKKRNLAETMRQYVQHRYPGYAGQSVRCDNCGKLIHTLKFENISHIQTRGARPDKAHDFKNMEILCAFHDYPAGDDLGCHELWEHGKLEEFKMRKAART